jgi:DNA-binding beta-propeller fold protein YncE
MARSTKSFPFPLFLLVLPGFLSAAPPVRAQEKETEQVKGTLAEPADAAEVREQIASVEKLLPQLVDRGAALYFLSASKQHLGETLEAFELLKKCLALHEGFDPAGSPNLRVLKGSKEFDDLVESVHRDFPVVGQARLAFVTDEKDLVPEGLAYDARQDVYYLSSLHRRKIVKITAAGRVSDFVPSGRDHLLPVLGIRPDPKDGTVWANSWSEDVGRAELLHFAASGKLLGRYALEDALKHGFNDLVVRKDGEVLLTDSVNNQVFRFNPVAHTFARLPVHRLLSAPNGIALADDDRQLYVADDFGVVRVDLDDGVSKDLRPGSRSTLAGIDGLYWHKGSLIAVQNGIGSPRIAAFRLSKDGSRVTQTTVLENRTSFTYTPTTGAIHGNNFYFIANSQIDNLNGDRIMDVTKLAAVRIAVVPLP